MSTDFSHRVVNDLLMWEPLAPSPVNTMGQFSTQTLLPSRLDLEAHLLHQQSEQFTMCKSGIQYGNSNKRNPYISNFQIFWYKFYNRNW